MSHVVDVSNEVMVINVPVIGLVGTTLNSIAFILEHQVSAPMKMAIRVEVVRLAA